MSIHAGDPDIVEEVVELMKRVTDRLFQIQRKGGVSARTGSVTPGRDRLGRTGYVQPQAVVLRNPLRLLSCTQAGESGSQRFVAAQLLSKIQFQVRGKHSLAKFCGGYHLGLRLVYFGVEIIRK